VKNYFINLFKETIKINISNVINILISLLFSFLLIYGSNVHYNGLFGKITDNYVTSLTGFQIVLIFIVTIVVYIILNCICLIVKKLYKNIFDKKRELTKKKFLIEMFFCIIILNILWVPYYLSYYPGNIFSDGFTSINQVLFTGIDNHHTILYTSFIGLFAKVGNKINNLSLAIFMYTILQSFIMTTILSYFIAWLRKYNIKKIVRIICLLFFGLFPLFPFYATTIWKDTYFSLAIFMYILFLIDVTKGKIDINNKFYVIKCIIISFFICFLRNNGIYLVILTILYFIILNIKYIKKYKFFISINIIFIIITFIIQGPIYKIYHYDAEFVETVSIPVQQIAATVSYDGKYNEKYISKIWNLNEIKQKYTPCLTDTMKWSMDKFEEEYFEKTKPEFFKTWLNVVINNPKIAIDAFFMENLGYWHIGYADSFSYIQAGVWDNFYGIKRVNYFDRIFSIDIDNVVIPKRYISSGLLFWLIILSCLTVLKISDFKKILAYIPLIGLWITIMIATPVAFSLRYVYVFVLFIPLIFILPCIISDKSN